MHRNPGDIVLTTRRGVTVRYSPSMGSSVRYRVTCPHGEGVNARTQADAREAARYPDDFCTECFAEPDQPKGTTPPGLSSHGDFLRRWHGGQTGWPR